MNLAAEPGTGELTILSGKNFNLRVPLADETLLLVKQERFSRESTISGDFWHEWRCQGLLDAFPALQPLRQFVPPVRHFDPEHGILVVPYLQGYCDLIDFYDESAQFSAGLAAQIGQALARVHQLTLDQSSYRQFLCAPPLQRDMVRYPNFLAGLDRINPEVFGVFCADGLKFFKLFQRYDRLRDAIASLHTLWQPCCLIHYDCKLSNILIESAWTEDSPSLPDLQIIDWERCRWGDPAYDLGTMIADYLRLWLKSLVVSPAIDIPTALQLAQTPLEWLQPSLRALVQAYLQAAPQVVNRFPGLVAKALQFAGLALIHKILVRLEEQSPFDNPEICTLQIAHRLLCTPEQALPAIFGGSLATVA